MSVQDDKIIMLLSTDWFFDHWAAIGIGLETSKKCMLQSGSRNIVKQFPQNFDEELVAYYHLQSMEESTLTKSLFLDLMDFCKITELSKRIILDSLTRKIYTGAKYFLLQVLEDLTQLLVENYFDDSEYSLSPHIKSSLSSLWVRTERFSTGRVSLKDPRQINFESLSEESSSLWDQTVRQLVPDNPTFLVDDLTSNRPIISLLEYVWCLTCESLTEEQQSELTHWYCSTIEALTGTTIQLPTLSLTLSEFGPEWTEQLFKKYTTNRSECATKGTVE